MARRRASADMNLDSLLDTLTNVVGVLMLVLVLISLDVRAAVERIRELDPSVFGVSESDLAAARRQAESTRTRHAALLAQATEIQRARQLDEAALAAQRQRLAELAQTVHAPLPAAAAGVPEAKLAADAARAAALSQKLVALEEQIAQLKARLDTTPKVAAPPPKIVNLPQPREAPAGAIPAYFICHSGKVLPYDPDELKARVLARVDYLLKRALAKAGPSGEIDCAKLAEDYNKSSVADEDFKTQLVVENFNLTLFYQPKGTGETAARVLEGRSKFQIAARRLQGGKAYARFLVWPDSFDAYVAARGVVDELKLPAGWEPVAANAPWRLSLGVKVSCQGKPPPPKPSPDKPVEQPKEMPKPPPNDVID